MLDKQSGNLQFTDRVEDKAGVGSRDPAAPLESTTGTQEVRLPPLLIHYF